MICPGTAVGIGDGAGVGTTFGVGTGVCPGARCGAIVDPSGFGAGVIFGLGVGIMLHCGIWQQASLGSVTIIQPEGTCG